MKIVDVQQGSEEWLALRRSKITATDCAAIMGRSKYKSPHMVWLDKMGKSKVFENDAMKRGKELEPEARAYFNHRFELFCEPVVAISDKHPWQMASLDGWDPEKKVIIEIKCPGEAVFREAQEGKFQEDYILQCLHQLAVCSEALRNCLCYYFKGPNGLESVELTIDRDERAIIEIWGKEEAFYRSCMLGFVEPPLGPLDFLEQDGDAWKHYSDQWREIKRQMEALEVDEKYVRNQLIDLADDQSCRGAGIQLTKYTRMGSVDYNKVPELQGVDLSAYRKASIDAWRLSEVGETSQTD